MDVLKLLEVASNATQLDKCFLKESEIVLYETKGGEYQRNFIFKTLDGKYFKITIISRKAASLKQEKDDGYIEYKWKLLHIQRERLIRLISQMNYRLNEGDGKSIYAIGFSDNGSALGITKCEMKMTLHNIVSASKEIGANITKILIFINNNSYWAKIFINR
jgi:hypothetical protein